MSEPAYSTLPEPAYPMPSGPAYPTLPMPGGPAYPTLPIPPPPKQDPPEPTKDPSPTPSTTRGPRPSRTTESPAPSASIQFSESEVSPTRTSSSSSSRHNGGAESSPSPDPQQTSPPRTTGGGPAPTGGGQPVPGGDITLQPGSPTSYRNSYGPTSAAGISGSILSAPMTGAVFTFAFLAALLIGLIAGFLIARYTRLGGGGSRSRKQDRDDLAEHIRLLNDRLNHRNNDSDYCLGRPQQFRHDRTYLNDEKLAHAAANQAELMPLYMDTRRSVGSAVTAAAFASGGSDAGLERLHPHSVPDQSLYQDWDLTGSTPVMTSMSPFIVNHPSATAAEYAPRDSNPALFRTSATRDEMADYRGVRVVNLPPSQLPPDVEIYSPKGEWSSGSGAGGGVGGGGANASRTSVANLNEFERRRPQIQEDGLGEDSLFDIGHQSHNPHVTAIME